MLTDDNEDVPHKKVKKAAKKAAGKKAAKKAAGKKSTKKTTGKKAAKVAQAKKAGKKAAKKALAERTCFVIMPFGHPFDTYYERIFKPAIEGAGLAPHRADDLYRPSAIVNDIWAFTKNSRLLLADLTGKNPNVFYELGLAHAVAKPAILVAESIDDVPFDLRSLRVLIYDKDVPDWGNVLQDAIAQAISEVMAAPNEAVLPTFLTVRPERGSVTPHEKEILDLRRDIDLLRSELRVGRLVEMPSREIDRGSALALIRRLVERGLPEDDIVERLLTRGVPPYWARREVVRAQREFMATMPQTSGAGAVQRGLLDDVPGDRAPVKADKGGPTVQDPKK